MKRLYMFFLGTTLMSLMPLLPLHSQETKTTLEARDLLQELVAKKWGRKNTVLPSAKVLVQYESDLGERWIVDFESGVITLECLWSKNTLLSDKRIQEDMACAISNLYMSIPIMPELMIQRQQQAGAIIACNERHETDSYTVQQGDTLSQIAQQMRVTVASIMAANNINNPDRIRINLKLSIPPSPPHLHLPDGKHATASESLLNCQLTDPESGEQINANNIGEFGKRLVHRNGIQGELIRGDDGRTRRITRVQLKLTKNHLQIRARKYYPLVLENAKRFNHDPALIMAMVHTESAFNPRASSHANAYGLMQLVPASGAREAYRWLHSKDIKPSPAYLMRPRENLELGSAYMQLLQDRIFAKVTNPKSRLYCAVAAYNGGGGNVGRTFSGRKSVQASVNQINSKSPEQVLDMLKKNSPYKETRNYMKRVFQRIAIYRQPQWQP